MRRIGVEAAEHAADLGQLLHQVRLVLEPPGSVDDQHVVARRGRLLDAVEDDAGRIAAFLAGDHRRADALAPDLQLLDRCGAEGVAGSEQDAIILLLQPVCELADGRRLAGAVDADDEDHVRTWKARDFQRLGDRSQDLFDLLGKDRSKAALVEALELLLRDRLADAVRCLRTEVGGDQRFLDVVERRRVERRAAGEAGQIVGDPLGGLLETRRAGDRASSCPDRRQLIAVAAGDPSRSGFAAASAGDRDRREIVGVALAVTLDRAPAGSSRPGSRASECAVSWRPLREDAQRAPSRAPGRKLRHSRRRRARARREGEDVGCDDIAIIEQFQTY